MDFSELIAKVNADNAAKCIGPIPPKRDTQTGKPVVEISNSNLSGGCPRKRFIAKNWYHPDSNWDESPATMVGTAYHTAIQSYAVHQDWDRAVYDMFLKFDMGLDVIYTDYNKRHHTLAILYHTLESTFDKLPYQWDKLATFNSRPAIETKFNIILNHKDWANSYHFRGAIDLVFRDTYTNLYDVDDIKTTSKPVKNIEADFRQSQQLVPYGIVLQHLESDSDKLAPDNFNNRYVVIHLHAIKPEVTVLEYTRTQQDVQDWLYNVTDYITLVERWTKREAWPRTTESCIAWGNRCRYYDYCLEPDAIGQQELLGNREPAEIKPFGETITVRINL